MTDGINIAKLVYRIPVLGESQVGKSCILTKYLLGEFNEVYTSTIAIDKSVKKLPVKDKDKNEDVEITLNLMDTAGQERFRTVTASTLKLANGIFVVFSLTDPNSFEQVTYWMEQIRDNNGKVPIILIGNKCDLVDQRKVSKEDAEELAKKLGVNYFETSAKTGQGIHEAFNLLAQRAYDTYKQANIIITPPTKKEEKKKKSKC